MKPIAFFDLDGTIRDCGAAFYPHAKDISIYPGIPERLMELRSRGYLLAGATNQGGVAKKDITRADAEVAIAHTQKLLGDARLDVVFFCPHDSSVTGYDCNCKKPAPGMLLDALSALPGSTLEGGFMVGDSLSSDGGAAHALALPYFHVNEFFVSEPVDQLSSRLPKQADANREPAPDRVAGILVGLAVGDALGAPLEFRRRHDVRAEYPNGLREMIASRSWSAGEYTDDTQMALIMADSFLETATVAPIVALASRPTVAGSTTPALSAPLDPQDIARRFRTWAETAKDVGVQTRSVVSMRGYEQRPEACARAYYEAHTDSAAGNGAVMRCAPVALHHCRSCPMLLADSRRSARLTHGDPKAQTSCVLVNAAIRHFLFGGDRDHPWRHGLEYLTGREKGAWHHLEHIADLPEDTIRSGGYTVHTVEAAFWSFVRTATFEEAVVLAASLGDDADTVAAVTGALAGAYYGYKEIPQRWRKALKDEARIRRTALQLAGVELG